MKGKVKWFSNRKGHGFITGEDGKDYFAHYSYIKEQDGKSYRTLNPDAEVSFDIEETEKGSQAINIEKL